MTVDELRNKLSMLPADAEVVILSPFGGYDRVRAATMIDLVRTRPKALAENGKGRYALAVAKPGTRAKRTKGLAIL